MSKIKSKIKPGDTVLVTTEGWFFAPDGNNYRAVYGTFHGIESSEETLGVKTNAKSTNWYALVGNMTIAGCQIHYVINTDSVSFKPGNQEIEYQGELKVVPQPLTRIYNADT